MKVKFLNRNTILMNMRTNTDIVKWMAKNDYDTSSVEPIEGFIKTYAERKALFEKKQIRSDTIDHFIEDLVTYKVIEIMG